MVTSNRTYPWSSVTYIFNKVQPSRDGNRKPFGSVASMPCQQQLFIKEFQNGALRKVQRSTDNTMTKRTNNDLQTLHRKQKTEQHEPHYKPGVNYSTPEVQAVPAPHVTPVTLLM